MQSSKKLKRVTISRNAMFGAIGLLVMIDLLFLTAWTIVSPPEAVESRVLPDEFSTTVQVSLTCRSRQNVWPYMSMGWHTLLLIVASVLAFQSRDIVPDFNESRSFGTMIYSHFLFMSLRLIVFHLSVNGLINPNINGAAMSFLFSFDMLLATVIYVIPKCVEAIKNPVIYDPRKSITIASAGGFDPSRRGSIEASQMLSRPFSSIPISGEMNNDTASTVSNVRSRQTKRRSTKTSYSLTYYSSSQGASSTDKMTAMESDLKDGDSVDQRVSREFTQDHKSKENGSDLDNAQSPPMPSPALASVRSNHSISNHSSVTSSARSNRSRSNHSSVTGSVVSNLEVRRNDLSSHDAQIDIGIEGAMADVQSTNLAPSKSYLVNSESDKSGTRSENSSENV